MRKSGQAFLLLAGLISAQAGAQPRLRDLPVPATASWQHAASGLILPPTIAGLTRTGLQDSGNAELDVIAGYESPDRAITATIYLFRSQVQSAPLWFDRARTVLEQIKAFPIAAEGALPVRTFALPKATSESGLRVVYPVSGGTFSATGVAVAPLNEWTVKVRMSARSLDPQALDQKMADLIAGIRWPDTIASAPAAVPVQPCPTPLALKRAKMVKPDMGQALVGSLLALASTPKPSPDPVTYCREPEPGLTYGVYRPAASPTRYVIALTDAGRVIAVGESPNLLEPKKARYSVTLLDLGRSSVYPSYDRLPPPKQVMDMLPKTRPLSSSEVGTTTISIDSGTVR